MGSSICHRAEVEQLEGLHWSSPCIAAGMTESAGACPASSAQTVMVTRQQQTRAAEPGRQPRDPGMLCRFFIKQKNKERERKRNREIGEETERNRIPPGIEAHAAVTIFSGLYMPAQADSMTKHCATSPRAIAQTGVLT